MRKTLIVGNWKMNQTLDEVKSFMNDMKSANFKHEAWIAPQALHVTTCLNEKPETMKIGTQNCAYEDSGAFTGELSPKNIKEMGAEFVIIGHSERRAIFGETNETLYKKTLKALENNLTVIFCIGETLEEREAGKVEDVLATQLSEGLKNLDSSNIIIAYEPVWAIGTGVTATPEQAEETHSFVRNFLAEQTKLNADTTPILYGGSVKPANVADLLACPNIDGGLVGGASLKSESYLGLH